MIYQGWNSQNSSKNSKRETLIRLLHQKQSDLGLHFLSRPFFAGNYIYTVRNLEHLPYLFVVLKGKLELLTGATAANMKLELYNNENTLLCKVDNDDAMLGSYPAEDGMRLHVS